MAATRWLAPSPPRNNAIFSPTGGNVGVGFAIPSELAQPVIEQLRNTGKVKRGYLGVQIQNMSPAIASSMGLPKDRGEIIASVEPGGPARAAGPFGQMSATSAP